MIEGAAARRLATKWIEAWNRGDLKSIMSHYEETVVFSSPRVALVLGGSNSTLNSKQELAEYFGRALSQASDIRFELIDILRGVHGMTLYYRNHRGETVAEVLELNEKNQVTRADVYYARKIEGTSS